jgi:hypothetical protein
MKSIEPVFFTDLMECFYIIWLIRQLIAIGIIPR